MIDGVPETHAEAVATWDHPDKVDTRRWDAWMKTTTVDDKGTCRACTCTGVWDKEHCTAPDCRCHRKKGA